MLVCVEGVFICVLRGDGGGDGGGGVGIIMCICMLVCKNVCYGKLKHYGL